MPEDAKLKEAEKAAKDLFKAEYAKKAPADRQALARTLADQADKAGDDPAFRYVLLRESKEAALQAGDFETAFRVVDNTAKTYEVDGLALKSGVLAAAVKIAKTPDDFAVIAERYLKLADDAVAADAYDPAEKAASAAVQTSRRTTNTPLISRATARSRDVGEVKTRFEATKRALDVLAQKPDDPAANLEIGQFLCLIKGDWENGRALLAKGSDAKLKALAEKDIAAPEQAMDQVVVGDGWWDLAEAEKNALRRERLQTRAKYWYDKALPGVTSVSRVKIEKRLDTLDVVVPGTINLLRYIDPAKDAVVGTWSLKEGKLWSDNTRGSRLEIPYEPPAEYDFRVVWTRQDGTGDVQQFLTHAKRALAWTTGTGDANLVSGFGSYKNSWVNSPADPWTATMTEPLTSGRTYTVLIQMRKDWAKGFIDGKLIKELKSYDDMDNNPGLGLRSPLLLGLGSFSGVTVFNKVELIEITGKGKRTRQ